MSNPTTIQLNLFHPVKIGKFYEGLCRTCANWYHGRGKEFCSYQCRADNAEWRAAHSKQVTGKPSPCKGKPHPLGTKAADPLRRWMAENTTGKKWFEGECKTCGKWYRGRGRVYCSIQCLSDRTGRPKYAPRMTKEESIAKLVQYTKTNAPWNKGTKGVMKRNSGSLTTERVKGAANNNWKGGVTAENDRIRKTEEYKIWRLAVFQRDYFRCVICGYRSKYDPRKSEKCDIRADHIKPFCKFPELRFDIDNGRTLCIPCDREHGWNSLRDANDEFNYHSIKKKE